MCRSRTSHHAGRGRRDRALRAPDAGRETRDRMLRASDADRERTADVLREQAGEGRLEPDELEDRLERAFAARTLADLDALTADLPRRREGARSARPAPPLAALLIAAIVTLAIVVHPAIWFALIPALHMKHWGARGRTAWRGSPS